MRRTLWPFEVRDERILDFDLPPQKVVPPTQVIQSAEQLRNEAQRGLVTPMVKPAHVQMHEQMKQHMHKYLDLLHRKP